MLKRVDIVLYLGEISAFFHLFLFCKYNFCSVYNYITYISIGGRHCSYFRLCK